MHESETGAHGQTARKKWALDLARSQAHSPAARRDRQRRQHLMERSFADAANNHHFKRARWRRLWRQQIQDYLIAAIQNLRLLLAHGGNKRTAGVLTVLPPAPSGSRGGFFPHKRTSRLGASCLSPLLVWLRVASTLRDPIRA